MKALAPMLFTPFGILIVGRDVHERNAVAPIRFKLLVRFRVTLDNVEQPSNALVSIVVTLSGIETTDNAVQPLKTSLDKVLNPVFVGISIDLKARQFWNALVPIRDMFALSTNVTFVNKLQLLNTLSPIRVIDGGIVILVRLGQVKKRRSSITVKLLFVGNVIVDKELHDWNVFEPIRVIESVSVTLVNVVHPANTLLSIFVTATGIDI